MYVHLHYVVPYRPSRPTHKFKKRAGDIDIVSPTRQNVRGTCPPPMTPMRCRKMAKTRFQARKRVKNSHIVF